MALAFPWALMALTAVGAPDGLAAQDGRATLELNAGVRATSIRGESSFMGGGTALVRPWRRLALGGGGWILFGSRAIEPDSPGGGFRLRLAYGGLVAATRVASRGPVEIDARALLGAGSARTELSAPRVEIDADNFLVLEPEVGATARGASPFTARLGVSYRFVAGVEDVSGISARQLRGMSATIVLAYRPG